MNRLEEAHQLADDLIQLTDMVNGYEMLEILEFVHSMQDAACCITEADMDRLRELHRKYIGGQP